ESRVEHAPRSRVAEHGRNDVRRKRGRPHEAREGKSRVTQERHDEAEGELEYGRDPGIEEGVDDGSIEDAVRVAELEAVVPQADEVAQAPELGVRNRQPDPEQERDEATDARDEEGGYKQQIPERSLAVVDPHTPPA